MPFSRRLLPYRYEITLKIFFALGQTSHIEFDYDLYIYGGKLIFNASNFLCLIILSKMSKCIIMELPATWKMSHFLPKLLKKHAFRMPFEGIVWLHYFMGHSTTGADSDENLKCGRNCVIACFRSVMGRPTKPFYWDEQNWLEFSVSGVTKLILDLDFGRDAGCLPFPFPGYFLSLALHLFCWFCEQHK